MDNNKMNQTGEKKQFSLKEIWKNKRLRSILIAAGTILLCVLVYVILLFTVLKEEAK